jgi:hypothetical protein
MKKTDRRFDGVFVDRALLGLTIALFAILAFSAGIVTPTFESTDEADHFVYIQDLWRNRALPVLELADPHYEAYQPPAYYLISLIATFPAAAELQQTVEYKSNPFLTSDFTSVEGDNKNGLIHQNADDFPFRGTARAVHFARLASVFFGVANGLALLRLGWMAFRRADLVLAFMGLGFLQPGYIFSNSAINNDSAAALCGTLLIIFCWLVSDAPEERRHWIGLAIIASLATLSKATTLAFMPTVGVATLLAWKRTSNRRTLIANIALLIGIWLVCTGWWFGRNLVLYGDPIGVSRSLASHGQGASLPLVWMWATLPWIWQTFWGRFGIGTIPMPGIAYSAFAGLVILSLAGWIWRFIRPRQIDFCRAGHWLILCTAAGGMLAAVFSAARTNTTGAQGRYLYPAIGALSLLILGGVLALVPTRYHRRFSHLLWLGMASLSAIALGYWLPGAFALPPRFDTFSPPANFQPLDYSFGDSIRLHGYTVSAKREYPAGTLKVTLYWEALNPIADDYGVFLQLVDDRDNKVGQRETFSGGGMYPTSRWLPGQVVADTIVLKIDPNAPAPQVYRLSGGLWNLATGDRLPLHSVHSAAAELYTLGEIVIAPDPNAPKTTLPEGALGLAVDFSSGIKLRGCAPPASGAKTLALFWEATAPIDKSYTVFVHLWDDKATNLIGGLDHLPAAGRFPSHYWQAGDWIADEFALPDTNLIGRVDVGLYDSLTLQRLPILKPSQPDGVFSLPAECWTH